MINETHDAALTSWVPGADRAGGDFPIQNLPLGAFVVDARNEAHLCVAIGDCTLDLRRAAERGLLDGLTPNALDALRKPTLNEFMALGAAARKELRLVLSRLLRTGAARQHETQSLLHARTEVQMVLPASIGDYTDFYTSIHHASNAGKLFRPDNPLYPNFTQLPVAYHGRASSIVASGHPARRPWGQLRRSGDTNPVFAPTGKLDFELELGAFIGTGNALGEPIPATAAEEHMFGMCILNDWSARDIQAWEYQPLGPFLGKSFLTSISPWIVTLEALAPFRTSIPGWPGRAPALPYLRGDGMDESGALMIEVEVAIQTELMRQRGVTPVSLARASFGEQYWTIFQMIAHHASNGCNLRSGDLLGTGTISGQDAGQEGCLLEKTMNGARPVALPTGENRSFLGDGDEVIMSARCARDGYASIGFGECRGRVLPSIRHAGATADTD